MPRDGQQTRQRLLDVAQHLVIEQGFAATSVDEVIAGAQSSKGAFFNHFPTKHALAVALVERYADADIDQLERELAAVEAETDDPAEQLVRFVRRFEDAGDELMAMQSGCLFVSIVTEHQLVLDGTADPITRSIEAWRDRLAAKVAAALDARPAVATFEATALADHVFVTFEGAFVLCRSTGDPSHMRRQLGVLRRLLEALFDVQRPA